MQLAPSITYTTNRTQVDTCTLPTYGDGMNNPIIPRDRQETFNYIDIDILTQIAIQQAETIIAIDYALERLIQPNGEVIVRERK